MLHRRDKKLRLPTVTQAEDIAAPLARIAVRFLPMDKLGPVLMDLAEAGTATQAYVTNAPDYEKLITRQQPKADLPDFTQEDAL